MRHSRSVPVRYALCFSFLILCFKAQAQEVEDVFPRWLSITDAKSSLYKYLTNHAIAKLDDRKASVLKNKSARDWQQRQNQVKATFDKILGSFPKKAPLNAMTTGVVEQDGVKVEKLYYESLPGYYVTAALFLPSNSKGKLPAIVFCSGHSPSGFRSRGYQHSILNFVKKGFAVLAFDPIGQGERRQFQTIERRKAFSTTQDHSYPGNQVFLTGRSPAYYFIWDGIRAIDYLYSRPEIDTSRIGVTGRSGGGTQTAYIAAFDSRVKAAAPECYVTSFDKLLMTRGPQDAEQNFAGSIAEGLDISDLLLCYAPKPMLVVSTTRDIFNIQGARDVFSEVKQAYTYLGHAKDVSMVEDDAEHASTRANQEATYRFFQQYLSNPGNSSNEETVIFKNEDLYATPTGNVYTSLKGHNLQSLAKSHALELIKKRTEPAGYDDLKKRISNVVGFPDVNISPVPAFSGTYNRKNYAIETYLLKSPTGYLPVYWLKPNTKSNTKKVTLLLDDRGKIEAVKEGGLADSLALGGIEVVVPDLDGFGELSSGYIKSGDAWVDRVPSNLWYTGVLINESLLSVRMKEISVLLDWLKQTHAEVDGIASGVLTVDLLHTAMMRERGFHSLACIDPLISYQSLVEEPAYQTKFIMSGVPGMIGQYDINHLIRFLSTKNSVLLINPRNGAGDLIEKSELISQYKLAPGNALQAAYTDGHFTQISKWSQLK